jgi:hypothetical protein
LAAVWPTTSGQKDESLSGRANMMTRFHAAL